ncbi:MAG: ABC-F family ATP-binding cassette domain-containing protein [Lachnospiraceae bacterium]|jgi:ATP-binding cassette subfamily F protein uup|nr:ABC-F family ATP-binding cassette domain-containing protein [Lachnospiraceae bacterium]
MNLLTAKEIQKSYTEKALFTGIDLGVEEGDKIGIVGINGTGKSTLLRILAGLEEPDAGTVVRGSQVYVRYLPQEPVFPPGITIYDYVVTANKTEDNEWSIAGDSKTILNRMGFPDESLVVDHLSGGQKKMVALAAALVADCDILLLDEPTNHLNSEMVIWLEEALIQRKGALAMVTHDRYFLDRVCTKIVEIHRGKLYQYQTSFSGFLEAKAAREDLELATYRKNRNILRIELEWMRRGARARATKQKAHIQRYEELRDSTRAPAADGKVEVSAVASRLGKKTLELCGLTKSYGERLLIRDFSYVFCRKDRIGFVGPNGCGKTTLMRMIMGLEQPDRGQVITGPTVKIGYFSQENEALDPERRVIDYIRDTAEYVQTEDGSVSAAMMLERFLFDGVLQYSQIKKLSGGEKRRLYLLKVLMEAPNILILDEPTNDLDIQTLAILEDYLERFPGILIMVSHDRYFLDKTAERLFAFGENGRLRQYEGGYSAYLELRQREAGVPVSPVRTERASEQKTEKVKTAKLKFTWQEQKDYDSIEAEIEKIEEKIADLEQKIQLAATDFMKLNELTQEKEAQEGLLEAKMERYIYLSDLAERIREQE